jgi:hypothetical protein
MPQISINKMANDIYFFNPCKITKNTLLNIISLGNIKSKKISKIAISLYTILLNEFVTA